MTDQNDFMILVANMRYMQKAYFKTRGTVALLKAKELERNVDALLVLQGVKQNVATPKT